MTDHCGYPRAPLLSPFMFSPNSNPNDPSANFLRERAAMLGIPTGHPPGLPPGHPNSAFAAVPRPPMMWRPPMNPSEMYNFLAASAAYPPWYLAAALASASAMSRSSVPVSQASGNMAFSPHSWPSGTSNGHVNSPSPLPLDFPRQSMGPSVPSSSPSTPHSDSSPGLGGQRYNPYPIFKKEPSGRSESPTELSSSSPIVSSSSGLGSSSSKRLNVD